MWTAVALALLLLIPRALPLEPPFPRYPFAPLMSDPVGIVFHHSESAASYHGVTIDAAALNRIHNDDHRWAVVYQGKVYHIGYHYVILPDGAVEPGRPERCPGAHARRHNNWIGICFVGNFDPRSPNFGEWPRRPTERQVAAALSLCEDLMLRYHIPPERIKRHRDVNETNCPGRRFPYRAIMARLDAFAALRIAPRTVARR